jgi:hypothetical protein
MKEYGGVDLYIHIFLTSALVGGEWSASRPCCFTPRERTLGIHWIGGWVCPRAGLDDMEKRKCLTLSGLELRPLSRPARSQSLYLLRYPGSSTSKPYQIELTPWSRALFQKISSVSQEIPHLLLNPYLTEAITLAYPELYTTTVFLSHPF